MDTRGMFGRVYIGDQYILLDTIHKSFGVLVFIEFYFTFSYLGADDHWHAAILDPSYDWQDLCGAPLHRMLLHTKYTSFAAYSFRKDFSCFPVIGLSQLTPQGAWPVWTPEACLAGFILLIHTKTQSIKALGLVVSETIFFSLLFFGSYLLPWGPFKKKTKKTN